MKNHSIISSECSTPQRRLPPLLDEIVGDWEEIFQQMEIDGCPPAVATHIRELFRVALAEILTESKRRNFLLSRIKHHVKFLSGFPAAGAMEAIDEIERLALRLPDRGEQQRVLRWIDPLRKSLPGGGV